MTSTWNDQVLAEHGLMEMGHLQDGTDTLLLLGPKPEFWQIFKGSQEAQDGQKDPIDRWSFRVISALAEELGARPEFPFGGPPYAPFLTWALNSGRAWSSPVGMLVHDVSGLMVSYRGALRFVDTLAASHTHREAPCLSCKAQACISTCPVGALGPDQNYDVAACKSYLREPEGIDCLQNGCLVRRACPVSLSFGRDPLQSGYHMKVFLGD
ncbi:MAG: ferredoxin [Pseudomonadota bacterium]